MNMIRAVMNDELTDVETTADAGLAGVGEVSIVRVPCCEDDDQESTTIATVYVRSYTEDSATKWESLGILNGEEVFHEANYDLRKYAIEDAVRTLAAEAAESTSRSDKLAAKFILAYLQEIEAAEGDAGPEGEPSEWPAFAGAEGATVDSGEPEIEDAGVPLAGEGEIVGSDGNNETPTTPQAGEAPAEPTREQRIELNRRKNAQAAAIHEQRLSEVRQELADWAVECSQTAVIAKQAKARLKEVTEEYERLLNRGPEVLPLFDGVSGANIPHADKLIGKLSDVKTDGGTVTATLTLGGEPIPVVVGEAEPTNNPQAPASDPAPAAAASDAWRSRPTTELGLPPKLTEKLADNGIETIGKLEDQRGSFDGLRGIKGIGEAKADAIEDAVLAWLSRNRDAGVVVG
jgi:hypothetical protein